MAERAPRTSPPKSAGVTVTLEDCVAAAGPLSVTFDAPGGEVRLVPPGCEKGGVAIRFGPPQPASAVDLVISAELPARWHTTIDVVSLPSD